MTINAQCGQPIILGWQTENLVEAVLFDKSAWISEFGPGAFQLVHKRRGDAEALPVAIEVSGGIVRWNLTAGDVLYRGNGEAQLRYYNEAGQVKASEIYQTRVERSLVSDPTVPEPMEGWVEQVIAAAASAELSRQNAETAETGAQAAEANAEAWATGGTGGTPSETNNAKYYAENAADSAEASARSATAASGSASAASSSASSAASSATAASGSATNAAASAEAAVGSASAASGSATAASGSASSAASSATAASGSATNAASSASAAASSAASVAASAAQIETNTANITGLKADVISKVDAFFITGNLLFNSVLHKNQMYYGTAVTSSSYSYFEIDITNGTKYYCNADIRYLYNENRQSIIGEYVNHTYTATYTGKLYATFYNTSKDWIFSTQSDFTDIAGYKTFPFRKGILLQTTGSDEKFPMSQKATSDSISAVDASIAETNTHIQMYEMDIEWLRKVDGKAWGTTTIRSYSGFTSTGYLPCKPGDTVSYTLALPTGYSVFARFDASKNCLGYVEGTGNANLITNTYTFVEDDAYFMLSTVKRDSFASYGYKTYYNGGNIQKWINDSLAEFGQIPDYWRDTMATICNTLNQNVIAMADHGDTFVFITDQHWSSNAQHSPELIKYIADRVRLTMVASGGDIVNSKNATKLGAVNEIVNYYKEFRRCGLRLFSTIGNHDLNTVGNADTSTHLTKDELYPVMLKDAEEFTTTAGSNVTVFDNESQKIRYIQFYYTADSGYIEVVNTALMDALDDAPAGWTVVLFSHAYWTTGETVPTASSTYANHILAKMDEMDATVACWIVGHIHNDLLEQLTSTGGKVLNIISTSTDSYKQMQNATNPPYTMTKGTTTEQCFDVVQIDTSAKTVKMTRVGVGNNRSYSYAVE